MPCEACHVQFGLITRKKCCAECRRLFCRNCLERRDERILCQNCRVLTKRPLSKVDLGQLKVKELIFYLQSKHISTSGCVEKDDLINLVLAHVNTGPNSPRSPLGSPGSPGGTGNGTGAFHFSSASSTGGSSGGGGGEGGGNGSGRRRPDGGRGSNSGASSRYGQFYSASAENCANTFDQIKNTCQNLFSSISEKLGSDAKSQQNHNPGGPRFSNSSTEENLRPRHSRTSPSVYEQPRFGSNDVYEVNLPPPTTTPGISPTDDRNRRIVPNASRGDDGGDAGSGLTSGADDTSANTSSVSSPEHRSGAADALSVRIENMLASDPGGCDCSDEEDEKEVEAEGEPKKAASEENLLPEVAAEAAGPSQRLSVPESNTDTCSSSFDELNPECVASLPVAEPPTADPTDPENWQIVHVPTTTTTSSSPINESTLPQATISTATMTEQPPTTTTTTNPGDDVPPVCPSQAPRRHSDSFLLAVVPSGSRGRSPAAAAAADEPQSSQPAVAAAVITNKCFKCGKRRNGLRRQLKKFRKQLGSGGASEADKRRQLEAFLGYLERRSKGSLELSTDTDSITDQDASISLALEGEQMDFGGGGGAEGSSHYPWEGVASEQEVKINVYSSGNQDLANMSHIKLSDIKESADLDVLSVKQLKELLMLNRVDFKGCCEKPELRERVLRLWRDYKSIPSIEKLTTDDLCKICMDAPIECVILECGHMTTCTACGKVLSECPICRQYIVRVVRFFRA